MGASKVVEQNQSLSPGSCLFVYKYEITIKVLLQLMAHKKATKLTSFYVQKKCSRLQSSFTFNQRTSVVGGGDLRTSGKILGLLLHGTYYD